MFRSACLCVRPVSVSGESARATFECTTLDLVGLSVIQGDVSLDMAHLEANTPDRSVVSLLHCDHAGIFERVILASYYKAYSLFIEVQCRCNFVTALSWFVAYKLSCSCVCDLTGCARETLSKRVVQKRYPLPSLLPPVQPVLPVIVPAPLLAETPVQPRFCRGPDPDATHPHTHVYAYVSAVHHSNAAAAASITSATKRRRGWMRLGS